MWLWARCSDIVYISAGVIPFWDMCLTSGHIIPFGPPALHWCRRTNSQPGQFARSVQSAPLTCIQASS